MDFESIQVDDLKNNCKIHIPFMYSLVRRGKWEENLDQVFEKILDVERHYINIYNK